MSDAPLPQHDADRNPGPGASVDPASGGQHRDAARQRGEAGGRGEANERGAVPEPSRKQHGDALLDGSGSRQGQDVDPARDAAPHE